MYCPVELGSDVREGGSLLYSVNKSEYEDTYVAKLQLDKFKAQIGDYHPVMESISNGYLGIFTGGRNCRHEIFPVKLLSE